MANVADTYAAFPSPAPQFMSLSLSRIEQRPSKPCVGSSNLFRLAIMVDIAQLVSVPGCGPGGRGFESHYSPHNVVNLLLGVE